MRGLMNALAPVDAAAARERGTRNALSTMKARNMANSLNRNQAIRQTGRKAAQGGYSTEEHANALRKMGHTDAANKLVQQGQQIEGGELQNRGRELGNVAKGYEIVARTAPLARDQRSWERVKSFWEEKGLAQAGDLPDEFDPRIARKLSGKAREKLSKSDLVEVQDPNNPSRTIFVPADMAPGMSPGQDQGDFDQVNVALPNGERVRGRKGPGGSLQILDQQGNWVEAPRDAQRVGVNLSGSEDDVGITNPEKRNFRELEAQMPVVERLQSRIQEGLSGDRYVGGITGGTMRALNSLRNQVSQAYSQFNRDKPKGERDVELSVDRFKDSLGEATNMSNQVQSAILDLAYMTLKAKDPSGRVSDKDIERELDTFGLQTSSPGIIMERTNEKIGDLYANYKATASGLGMEPRFGFDPSEVPDSEASGEDTGSGSGAGNTGGGQGNQSGNDPLGIR